METRLLSINKRASRRTKVLLVDDHPMTRSVLTDMLEDVGYRAESVTSGAQALAALDRDRGAYSAILLDCQMPGMSGFETSAAVRAREQEIGAPPMPIIALTGQASVDARERCLAAGMNAHLAKPVDLTELASVVRQYAGPASDVAPSDVKDCGVPAHPATNASPAGGPPIDSARAARLITHSGAGTSAGRGLSFRFKVAMAGHLDDMRHGLAANQLDLIGRSAHGLRGAAAFLGASEVQAICAEIEELVQRAQHHGVAALVARLAVAAERVVVALTREEKRLMGATARG